MNSQDADQSLFVSTHALGKFGFCQRAGILAFESGKPDDEDDWSGTPRLDYRTSFDVATLLQERRNAEDQFIRTSILTAFGLGILGVIGTRIGLFFVAILSVILLILSRKAYLHAKDYFEFSKRLKRAEKADVARLGDPAAGKRRIDWWGLVKDEEFLSSTPMGKYVDSDLMLSGKPARIATFRGGRIPVILHFGELDAPKPYHQTRLGAYAVLIERGEVGRPVEWGIILNPGTMKGLAIPLSERDKTSAIEILERFQASLREVQVNGTDPLPAPESHCLHCPYGRPRRFRRGVTDTIRDGEAIDARVERGNDNVKYHSACGDRFDWIPPHEAAFEKDLR